MRKKQFYSAVATALIFMAVTVGLSWAQDFTVMEKPSGEPRINIGNLTIIPGLQGVMTYDDNIYKGNGKTYANAKTMREEKVVSDMIYHLKPGIMANFIIPERGGITAGWTLDRAWYNTETNNNFQNNGGFLNFDYKMPEGIIIGLKDTYSYNTDPYGNADQYGVGTLTERWSNEFNAKTGYTIGGNFRPMLYYNYYIQQYNNTMKDWAQNYGQNQFGAGLQYRVMPNTWAFVRYMYTQKSYIDNLDPTVTKADSKTNAAQFGFAWDSGAKLSGEVNFGYQWRRYDNEYVNVNNTGVRREEVNSWSAATNVNFTPLEKTILGLSIWRTLRDSGSNTNENFWDSGIGLNLSHNFFTKFTFKIGGSFAANDYNRPPTGSPTNVILDKKRQDSNWTFNTGLDYAVQDWLGCGVGYALVTKNSNYEENDYVDNQISVNLKIVY